jgi:integrase
MAKRVANIYQRKKKRAGGEIVVLPTWWIKYRRHGQVFRESSGSANYEEAKRFLNRRLGEVATGKFAGLAPERITFSELAKLVTQDYRENNRATVKDVQSRLANHLLPAFADIRAADFGTSDIKRYKAKRLAQEAANASINRELAIVKRAFRLAAQCDPPKVARVPVTTLLQEHNVRTGFLEHEAYLKLLDELPEEVKPILVVGYHTGARHRELINLKWRQVDLPANQITLDPGTTKNGEGRTLIVYGDMRHWLQILKDAHAASPQCEYVFHRNGVPIKNFRKSWDLACERAGIGPVLFHDLRRTAVRNMVRAGIPEKVAMQISGHKTRSVFDRYNIVNNRDLTEAARKMEAHLSRMGTLLGTPADVSANDLQQKESKLLN